VKKRKSDLLFDLLSFGDKMYNRFKDCVEREAGG
jgi:hypothetical protein